MIAKKKKIVYLDNYTLPPKITQWPKVDLLPIGEPASSAFEYHTT